jgi:hypothetical protein
MKTNLSTNVTVRRAVLCTPQSVVNLVFSKAGAHGVATPATAKRPPSRWINLLAALALLVGASLAQPADGPLVSWGSDGDGLVSGTPAGTFTAVAAGAHHSVAIKPDGTLVTWGRDNFCLVSGTPAGTFTAVAAGGFHCVAIRLDGTLVSWGRDDSGQVSGTPTPNHCDQVSGTPAGTFTTVAAGLYHSVAIKTDGTLVSWGGDPYGEVSGTPAGTFTAVAAGYDHSVAIKTDGTLISWGDDSHGQVSGTPAGTFTAVAAGASHSVAIKTDGTLVSWGNEGNELYGTPTGDFTAVAAGGFHSMAIKTDGTLVSWGDDSHGQVSGTPEGTFTAVAAGVFANVAIQSVADCDTPVATITGPASGAVYAVGAPVTFTGTFIGANGPHTAQWTIDGNVVAGVVDEDAQTVTSAVTFAGPGVYAVQLAVANDCGNSATTDTVGDLPAMVVIYDSNGGYVTGGGWINSPSGAYAADPSLSGKASFGFVSRYQKGAAVPTGETQFRFQLAGFIFDSTSYDWLVVAGARAQYKGSGTFNNAGNYGFMLTAIDGQVNGGGVDKFRIKIWEEASGTIVYDNQLGAGDSATPSTAISGGGIVIHAL